MSNLLPVPDRHLGFRTYRTVFTLVSRFTQSRKHGVAVVISLLSIVSAEFSTMRFQIHHLEYLTSV